MSIRILIADDQALVRAGFKMILDAEDDLDVIGEAVDGLQAVEMCRRLAPDVVVRFGDEELCLEIADRGGGASRAPRVEGGGHGLLGMRERVRVFGGELHAGPRAEGGYLVAARLPLQDEEEAALAASTAGRDHTEVLG